MPDQSRLKAAIEIIKEGHSFNLGNLLISLSGSYSLEVTGWSQSIYFESLTKLKCLEDLINIKLEFQDILLSSNDWSEFVRDKIVSYSLNFDSGKAGIGICREATGEIMWIINLKE